ncbi:MAG: hypothetical protein KDH15_04985 [Rhodocyclaceae bacterium]|nr:hypothetical protein [Rhodocyclaceae bacterium]
MKRWNGYAVASRAFLLLAIAATLGSLFVIASRAGFWITADSATGTVVGWRQMSSSSATRGRLDSDRARAAAMRFEPADGTPRLPVADWGSGAPPYEIGEQVTELYDPGDPQDAMIRGFVSLYLGPLLLPLAGGCGIAALVLEFLNDARTGRQRRS